MKRTMLAIAALPLLALGSAHAGGSFGVAASYWDTKDADKSAGGGIEWASQLGRVLDYEFRASYFEQLDDEPLDVLFDGDSPFETGIKALPVDLGLRFNFARDAVTFHPYASVGASYYFLDSDFGSLDDEIGWYGGLGTAIGDGQGVDFFAQLLYRSLEGTADISEIGDDAFQDRLDVDLSGVGVNAGVRWTW